MAKAYYRLRHHVYIVNMVRKHIWFILFRARTKKRHFGGADPAGIGQAGSQTGQVLQMQDLIHHCVPHVELIETHIWFAPFGVRMK